MTQRDWPAWWQWELEFVPHLLKRMGDRDFDEIALRLMLERATAFHADVVDGSFAIATRHAGRNWEVIAGLTLKQR